MVPKRLFKAGSIKAHVPAHTHTCAPLTTPKSHGVCAVTGCDCQHAPLLTPGFSQSLSSPCRLPNASGMF